MACTDLHVNTKYIFAFITPKVISVIFKKTKLSITDWNPQSMCETKNRPINRPICYLQWTAIFQKDSMLIQ